MDRLRSDARHGLDRVEAARRLREHGPNELLEQGRKSTSRVLLDQFASLMVGTLLVATALSALVDDYKDAFVIVAILVINILLGFAQEYRAERALAALKRLAMPTVKVRRGPSRRSSGRCRSRPASWPSAWYWRAGSSGRWRSKSGWAGAQLRDHTADGQRRQSDGYAPAAPVAHRAVSMVEAVSPVLTGSPSPRPSIGTSRISRTGRRTVRTT